MSKRKTIALLILLALAGSFVCFYATNLILSDVANMFYMTVTKDVFSSLPIFFAALDLELFTIALLRLYMRPQYKKRAAKLYLRILFVFSALGILFTLITGGWIYGSFTVPYPFRGAILLSLIWHTVFLLSSLYLNKAVLKWQDDTVRRKMRFGYVIYTVFLCVLVFFAFNRFGALLWMPFYVQSSTLNVTWPFYLSLPLPMALLGQMVIYMFDIDRGRPKMGAVYVAGVLAANLILGSIVIFRGLSDPVFNAAVSPAVAIERLITIPIDTFLMYGLMLILGIYGLNYALRGRKVK